uniref:Uncharacterized protein MANES_10G135100 n=1 Tax=Rhizophora mucronata TaxID=61149 RepID=A0A2P2MNS1_RHIMU
MLAVELKELSTTFAMVPAAKYGASGDSANCADLPTDFIDDIIKIKKKNNKKPIHKISKNLQGRSDSVRCGFIIETELREIKKKEL